MAVVIPMVKHVGSTVNKWNTKYFPDIVTAISSTNFLVPQSVGVHKHNSKCNILRQEYTAECWRQEDNKELHQKLLE
jgi:hypothetical protein